MSNHIIPTRRKRFNLSLVFIGVIFAAVSGIAVFVGQINEANVTLILGLAGIFFGAINDDGEPATQSVGDTIAHLAVKNAQCQDDLADCEQQLAQSEALRKSEQLLHTAERIRLITEKNTYWKLLREK